MFKKILVRAPNWLGDAVMATPTLASLRERFKKAEITLLAKPSVAALFLHHPDLDRIFVYDDREKHAGPVGFWRLIRSLRKEGFDLAFLLQNAFEAALIARLAGIPERAGYAADGRRLLLTRSLAKKREISHQRDSYLNLMRLFGEADGEAKKPYLTVAPEEKRRAAEFLISHKISEGDLLVGLNPGAAYGSSKRWLPARFAAVGDELIERHRAKIMIFGGPAEVALSESVAREMRHAPVVLAGKTGIREMVALIAQCRLFITNDSGPMHIASALGIPVVAVFGPTNPAATSPAGVEDVIVQTGVDCAPCAHRECPIDHRCMEGVTTESVLKAAERKLRSDSGRLRPSPNSGTIQARGGAAGDRPTGREGRKIAVFLDRDGTVNHDVGHMDAIEKFALIDGAAAAIGKLNRVGVPVFLVTNQSGVARGLFTEAFLGEVHRRLQALLAKEGAFLDGIYYCPHHPDFIPCSCRKPAMGMIEKAVLDHRLDLSGSYVVGDKSIDMSLAQSGAKGVLVQTGYGKGSLEEMRRRGERPDHVAETLEGAVGWILGDMRKRRLIDA